nr:hypothetical protein [Tanacetum cinerariifolium]
MTVEQFSDSQFKTTSFEYSPTPPKDKSKSKGIVTKENPLKDLIPLMDEGRSALKIPNLNQFNTAKEGKMTLDEAKGHMQEIQRLAFLKTKKEKSEKKLEDLVNGLKYMLWLLRNLVLPPVVEGSRGLVISKLELGIFFYNEIFLMRLSLDFNKKFYNSLGRVPNYCSIVRQEYDSKPTSLEEFCTVPGDDVATPRDAVISYKRQRQDLHAGTSFRISFDWKALLYHETQRAKSIIKEEHDEAIGSGIKSLGNMTFEELNVNTEDNPYDTEFEINVVKRMKPQNFDEEEHITFLRPVSYAMEDDSKVHTHSLHTYEVEITVAESSRDAEVNEADSDLELMPGDEVALVFGFKEPTTNEEDDQSQHQENLSKSNKIDADNVLEELADLANFKDAFANKPSLLEPLGHLHEELSTLTNKIQ